ncbi:GNAT family N-acetyltransferase [Streptomyces gamaensis]|uniref:GNAT family N-acetyltransferase n=1 Tax=Streptomyces gamaensis TaxID=1763542 RepID=A0ABW0Z4V2_9ACTN
MFSIDAVNDPERRDVVHARLRAANDARSPVLRALRESTQLNSEPLEVYASGPDGALAGGLVGHTQFGWLHIDLLWVDEPYRGAGLGSRLVVRAEEIARNERDCPRARVESWDFQAPGFYRRLGYRVAATVPDHPPGITDYLLVKEL